MLRIDKQIFERFPGFRLGYVVARGIENGREVPEVTAQLRRAEQNIRQSATSINDLPHIKVWREAYRSFGAKPKDYNSSVENLVRRVSKGHQLPHINRLVDIYNAISLEYILPVGGEDLDAVKGDIVLRFAGANERPVRLLGDTEERPPRKGEVIYSDDEGAICRRFNWKEADRTKLTAATRDAILVIEALPPIGDELLRDAVSELARRVVKYCGGAAEERVVSE